MTFSPDSRKFAVAVTGTATTVWDLEKSQPKQLANFPEYALALAFSPDSRTLASATHHGNLILRDPETGTIRKQWQLPGQINGVAFAPDGRHLLTINGNGTGYVLRLATADGRPVPTLTQE